MKFYTSLEEATEHLGGKGYTEKKPIAVNVQKMWPDVIRLAVIHDTPDGDVTLRRVECYGWRRSELSQ
jgi:hypothetical protein